jgi:hypothetical protein
MGYAIPHSKPNGVKTMSELNQLTQQIKASLKHPAPTPITAKPARKSERAGDKNEQSGAKAQAFALVQSAIAEAKGEGDTWNRYVARLVEFSVEARAEFMKQVREHTREMTEHVKASGETKEERRPYRDMSASARTRLAELSTIAHALNAGMVIGLKVNEQGILLRDSHGTVQPREKFYVHVGNARAILRAEGTASTKGRKRDPFIVATVKYIDKRDPAPGEEKQRDKLLELIAKAFPADFKAAHQTDSE